MNKKVMTGTYTILLLILLSTYVLGADGYTVSVNQNLNINEHGENQNVENICPDPVFVPTKTANEWYTGGSSFLQKPPGCVNIYCGEGTVCGTRDCSGFDNYYITGTQSAYYTSYCNFEDYNDVDRICDGSGGCVNTACDDYSTSTTVTAGACRYVSGCSGSTSGSLAYYSSGTSCSGTTDCSSNDNYYITGTQHPDYTSYCRYEQYNDVSNTCNGFGSCTSGTCNDYSTSTTVTAGTCAYVSGCSGSTSGSLAYYSSATDCSGTTDCSGNNYYYQSGTNSATGTSYCRYRSYNDVSNTCNGAGSCTSGTCDDYSDSTTGTAGTCKYVSVGSGGSSCSVLNYAEGTSCGTNMECDGAGNCVDAYTWSDPGVILGYTCDVYGAKQSGSCSPQGAINDYVDLTTIQDFTCAGGEAKYAERRQTCE